MGNDVDYGTPPILASRCKAEHPLFGRSHLLHSWSLSHNQISKHSAPSLISLTPAYMGPGEGRERGNCERLFLDLECNFEYLVCAINDVVSQPFRPPFPRPPRPLGRGLGRGGKSRGV